MSQLHLETPAEPTANGSTASTGGSGSTWWGRNWLAMCALALLVASDYKWRVRSPQQALEGKTDLTIYFELGLYAIVAALVIVQARARPRVSRIPVQVALLVGYVAYLSISVAWSPFRSTAGARAIETVVLLALVATFIQRGDRGQFHRLAHGFTVLVALSVLSGLVIRLPRLPHQKGRFTWLMVHPTTSGVFVGIAVVISVAYLLEPTGRAQVGRLGRLGLDGPGGWPVWLHWGLLVINAAGLLGTETRGAIFGAVAGCAVVLALQPPRRRLVGFLTLGWVSLLAALTSTSIIAAYLARGEDAEKLATLNDRTDLWSVAWAAIQHHPVYGWGLYASRGIFIDATGLGGGHNALVNVAVDLGAVGIILWAATVLSTIVRVLQATQPAFSEAGPDSQRSDRALCLGVMAFLIVDGVSVAGFGGVANVSATWFFLIVGWSVVIERARRADRAHHAG